MKAYGGIFVACLVTMAAVGGLFLSPYFLRGYRYPVGWDAAYYVWRAGAVTFDGLATLGTARVGTPLLHAILMRVTGQNGFTIVAIAAPLLAGILGLAAAAMVRAALGVSALWVPVIGLVSWVGFGHIGIVGGHFDQLLNATMVVAAFAAAVAFAGGGRGAVAMAMLLSAAGLAEWPFYLFASFVLVLGVGIAVLAAMVSGPVAPRGAMRPLLPLAVGAAVSGAVTTVALLVEPTSTLGVNLAGPRIHGILKERFLARLRDPARYYAVPLAALGAIAVRTRTGPGRCSGRRLFLSLMAAWTILTVVAGFLQLAGIPVAGARLSSYFFAVPILAGVFVWWVGVSLPRRAGRSGPPQLARPVAAAVAGLVVALVGGLGVVALRAERARIPWVEPPAVRQAVAAGAYVERLGANRNVVYLFMTRRVDPSTVGRWWHVVRASIPPDQVPTASKERALPADYVRAAGIDPEAGSGGGPLVVVLQRYNEAGYAQALQDFPGHVVAPGVIVLGGALPSTPVSPPPVPLARTRPLDLAWLVPALLVVLFAVGSGWSWSLLPDDPVVRLSMAPALGVGTLVLLAALWDRIGLGFSSLQVAVLVPLGALLGWAAAVGRARREREGWPREAGPPAALELPPGPEGSRRR